MADDDDTPAVTPRARRHTSVTYSLIDDIAGDIVSWAEAAAGMRLPPLPASVRDRNAIRLSAIVRTVATTEIKECDRLRVDLAQSEQRLRATEQQLLAVEAKLRTTEERLKETQHDLNTARIAMTRTP